MKEIISIIIIVATVVIASLVLEQYLESTSSQILEKLETLKTEIKEAQETNKKEKAEQIAKEVLEKWEEVNEIWSMIIIHEELDMIKLSMLEVNSGIEVGSFDDSLEEIDKTIFLVDHIKEKEILALKNIF